MTSAGAGAALPSCGTNTARGVLLFKVMIGALESGGDIVSVSCCDNEIFILKGDRDIVRLSNSPEGLNYCGYSATSPTRFHF